MFFQLISYSATVILSFYIVSFLQSYLHFLLGHHRVGRSIYRDHITCHHAHYHARALTSDSYIPDEKNLTPLFAIPALGLMSAAYTTLPLGLFVAHAVSVMFSYGLHIYLHTRFHLSDTWLLRFDWFKRYRALHFLHHKDMRTNFGIVSFLWDRLFGTFRDVSVHNPGEVLPNSRVINRRAI